MTPRRNARRLARELKHFEAFGYQPEEDDSNNQLPQDAPSDEDWCVEQEQRNEPNC